MSICVNCGKECDGILCGECRKTADKEKLISEISVYKAESCNNAVWNRIAASLSDTQNFRSAAYSLASELSSPRREYMTLVYLLGRSPYLKKDKRKWLYDNIEIFSQEGFSDIEKKKISLALFYNYYYDYRYDEAEEIAKSLYERTDLDANETYALCDYFIKTRRYEQADEMLESAAIRFEGDELCGKIMELLDNSKKRQLGKEKGGLAEYLPAAPDNRSKYAEFMKNFGIEIDIPVVRIREKRKSIPAADYPSIPVYRDAGFTSFVAYDIETTGLNQKFDSIIEIGAVRVVNGVVSEEEKFVFRTFVCPYKTSIKPIITELTGITKDMVKDAPDMWDAFDAFADFIGDDIILGFNNNRFDDNFLVRAGRYANRIITNKSFDVLKYLRDLKDERFIGEKLNLENVSRILGIENPQAHRAVADAITTARIYLKLIGTGKKSNSVTLDDMLSDDDDWA